ncbi:hypothetical protein [Streptomyces sp. NPDC102462]|uniref:hypothetical protein n=1 Tax=Streptomyces sp. NPDC102462 TaxID=3366178 RepID=UPI0038164675
MQLESLPSNAVQNRWAYQLGVLQAALDGLDTLRDQWLRTRDGLPADARPGTPVFDDALAEYHAESWSYLDDWATHGHALADINSAVKHAASLRAPAPTASAPAAGRAVSVRR